MKEGTKLISISFEERQKIEDYLKQNVSGNRIAQLLNRSTTGIQTEILRGGGRDKYSAVNAHEIYLNNKKERLLKISKNLKGRNPLSPLHKRMQNLEMQIEILTDTIKEILKNDKQNKKL